MEKYISIRFNQQHLLMLDNLKNTLNKGMDNNLIIDDLSFVIRTCIENYYKKICVDETPLSNDFLEKLDKKTEIISNKFLNIIEQYELLSKKISDNQEKILDEII